MGQNVISVHTSYDMAPCHNKVMILFHLQTKYPLTQRQPRP